MSLLTQDLPRKPSHYFCILATLIVGFLVFSEYYPIFILNPFNVGWIFSHGDISTHHLGLLYFLKDAWRFPLGMNPNYGMENASSIVYTDSIPILGLALKPFTIIGLKGEVQFMGIFLFISSWANVLITYLIVERFSSKKVICLLAAWIIALIPIGAWRMMPDLGHASLTAQFVVIGALGVYFFRIYSSAFSRTLWLFLSFAIHPYFGFMAGILWGGSTLDRALMSKERLRFLLISSLEILCVVIGVYVIGYLGFSFEKNSWGYGFFSYNLLDFIDPTGYDEGPIETLKVSFSSIGFWSSPDKDTSWEGFSYLGLGGLCAIVTSSVIGLSYLATDSGSFFLLRRFSLARAFTFAAILMLFLLSLTHEIGVGSSKYFVADKFYVDQGLIESLATVRSSARLAWPLIYVVVIGSICGALSYMSNTPKKTYLYTVVLMFCLVLQYADLSGASSALKSSYESRELTEFERMLSTYVEEYSPKSLRLIHPESSSHKFLGIARVGSIYGVPTNVIYSARTINIEEGSYRKCPANSIIVTTKDSEYTPDSSCNLRRLGSSEDLTAYFVR